MEVAVKEGKYIYCIARISEPKSFGRLGIGRRGDELYALCYEDIAAVVSDSPFFDYSVSRENTIAHEQAIEEVMKEFTVLPVRFGTIAEGEEKVKGILEKEYARFKELLERMHGKKELGLKAVFKKEVVYKYISDNYDDIQMLKEKISSLPPEKTRNYCMEIGRMVEAALQREKAVYKRFIMDALTPLALEVKVNNSYGELMIVNAAFLVEKNKEREFDQKVETIDKKYGYMLRLKYVGTVPPFNFVNLVIETGG